MTRAPEAVRALWVGFTAVACAALTCAAPAARALEVERVFAGMALRSWTLEPDSTGAPREHVGQLAFPIDASFRLHPRVRLVASTTAAVSSVDPDGASTRRLGSLGDVALEVYWRAVPGRVLVTGGISLPTGNATLDDEELEVARVIGNPLAGFPATESGTGPDVSGSIVTSGTVGGGHPYALGLGVIRHGAYEIVPGLGDFTPGSEVSLAAGVDLGRALAVPTARVDVRWRSFGRDRWDGDDVYDAGAQVMLQTSIAVEEKPLGGSLLLRGVFRAEDRVLSPAGSDTPALTRRQGDGVQLRATVWRALSGGAHAGLALEWSHISGSDYPGFDGDLLAIGPVAELPWGRDVRVDVRLSYHTGVLEGSPVDVDVAGISLRTALTWHP